MKKILELINIVLENRDKVKLEELWNTKKAPWKSW